MVSPLLSEKIAPDRVRFFLVKSYPALRAGETGNLRKGQAHSLGDLCDVSAEFAAGRCGHRPLRGERKRRRAVRDVVGDGLQTSRRWLTQRGSSRTPTPTTPQSPVATVPLTRGAKAAGHTGPALRKGGRARGLRVRIHSAFSIQHFTPRLNQTAGCIPLWRWCAAG